jgi:antitoxin component YwqK of YwqJK toxin-antitoxin module
MNKSISIFAFVTVLILGSSPEAIESVSASALQESLFKAPKLEPQKTLGGLQLSDVPNDDQLESIAGEVASPSIAGEYSSPEPKAQLQIPDLSGPYGPVGEIQDGTRMFKQEPGSTATTDEPSESVLNQSLPREYRAETVFPADIFADTNRRSEPGSLPGDRRMQSGQTYTSPSRSVVKTQKPVIKNDRLDQLNRRHAAYSSATHDVINERYPDGSIKIMRTTTLDNEGNYQNDGGWLMFDRQQRPIASGTFEMGAMQGRWERIHEVGSGGIFAQSPFNMFQGPYKSTANFENDRINGTWELTDRLGKLMCAISYKDGVRDGIAIWKYPSGNRMREATFKAGVPDGFVQQWDDQGKVQIRDQYVDGRKIISKKSMYSNQTVAAESVFRDRKLVLQGRDDWWAAKPATYAAAGEPVQHGQVSEWYPNRQPKMTGRYSNGLREGMFTWWHPTHNKKAEGNFVGGKREGVWRYWHESGMKRSEGEFRADEPFGEWRVWSEQGQLIETKTFPEQEDDQESESENESPVIESPQDSLKVDLGSDDEADETDETEDRSMDDEGFRLDIGDATDADSAEMESLESIDAERIDRNDEGAGSAPADSEPADSDTVSPETDSGSGSGQESTGSAESDPGSIVGSGEETGQ